MPYVDAAERTRQSVAAARAVMARDGVARTTLRSVAAEAGVPLGTLQYVFPTKERLLTAVVEDVVAEIETVLTATLGTADGLERAVRDGLSAFWTTLVADQVPLQLMQAELLAHSLRSPEHAHLARAQYERYLAVLTAWCERVLAASGEGTALPPATLARVLLAGLDGLILQYVSDPDGARAQDDLVVLADMLVAVAGITPT